MLDALIGHTGFVGQTLSRQHAFPARFNSRNITDSAGHDFGIVVCAAAPGSMFAANRFPDRDRQNIARLCEDLRRLQARNFVLISTIAVLDRFDGQATEETEDFQTNTAYGANRRRLEEFCAGQFDSCLILRLPALFGAGLQKNFLFDLINPVPSMLTQGRLDALAEALSASLFDQLNSKYHLDAVLGMFVLERDWLANLPGRAEIEAAVEHAGVAAVTFTNPQSQFQFYDTTQLWADIVRGLGAGLSVLHLAPEAVHAAEVHRRLTGKDMPGSAAPVHVEDMRTSHAALWGRKGPYIEDASQALAALKRFYDAERAAR
ncbi:MAG: NAD-dependent epimerase/dehydratase family protein [bacterium]